MKSLLFFISYLLFYFALYSEEMRHIHVLGDIGVMVSPAVGIPDDPVIVMMLGVDAVVGDVSEEGIVSRPDFRCLFREHGKLLIVAFHCMQRQC